MDEFRAGARIAGGQHALLARAQLFECGLSPSMIQRWLAAGRLQPQHPGVYRVGGAPLTWEQSVAAAVMAAAPDAVASHRSAARLWSLHDDDVVEISLPRRRAVRLRGVVVHRSSDLALAGVSRRRGIAVTNPLRTLVDLGAVLTGPQVEDALDRALQRRLVTVDGVLGSLEAVARKGRTGAGALRRVLDERALGAAPADSLLEPRMARLLRAHGLPPAAFQFRVYAGGRLVAKVDFAYPAVRIAIEVDGHEAHSTPRALQSDLDRQNRLVALGWTVVRFTWTDVVRRPEKVADGLRRVLCSLDTAGRR